MVSTLENTILVENQKATLEDKSAFAAHLSTLQARGLSEINIDFSRTLYLPSEMMGLLMWKKKELKLKGITLNIIKISSTLKTFFDNMQISEFFELDSAEIIE